jgi:hypothetical protein
MFLVHGLDTQEELRQVVEHPPGEGVVVFSYNIKQPTEGRDITMCIDRGKKRRLPMFHTVLRMFIPDPDFYSSRIRDPKQQQKRGVKKN